MKQLLMSARIEWLDQAWKYFVNEAYVNAFAQCDIECSAALSVLDSDALVANYDGLLLCGGYDIDPSYYQAKAHPKTQTYERNVDDDDFRLLDSFVRAKKPILGICRGLQLINVYFHGTLCQHFEAQSHELTPHSHSIHCAANSTIQQLLGKAAIVNSYHHQCADQIGEDLCVSAVAQDGRVEALEHTKLPILSVQWHPERMEQDPIIPYFAQLLRTYNENAANEPTTIIK